MDNKIVNVKTGETFDIKKATDIELSGALSEVIVKIKELKKLEAFMKKHIKGLDLQFEENENSVQTAEFGTAKVRKSFRSSFDKKKFEKESSDYERDVIAEAEEVKKKYVRLTEVITFY